MRFHAGCDQTRNSIVDLASVQLLLNDGPRVGSRTDHLSFGKQSVRTAPSAGRPRPVLAIFCKLEVTGGRLTIDKMRRMSNLSRLVAD